MPIFRTHINHRGFKVKRILFFLIFILAACGSGPEELFETAEFELLQTNYPHASQLYQEIITKHPDSEFAATARQRLAEIKKKQEEN